MTQPPDAVVKAATDGRVSKGGFLPAGAWFVPVGARIKKRVLVENDLSGRHSKAENGGTLVEQAQIYSGALVQLGKMTCGGIGVAVSLPAAAAGEIAA